MYLSRQPLTKSQRSIGLASSTCQNIRPISRPPREIRIFTLLSANLPSYPTPTPLPSWYGTRSNSSKGYDLLCKLFEWDPAKRLTAREALAHPWFQEDGGVSAGLVLNKASLICVIKYAVQEADLPEGAFLRVVISHTLLGGSHTRITAM